MAAIRSMAFCIRVFVIAMMVRRCRCRCATATTSRLLVVVASS